MNLQTIIVLVIAAFAGFWLARYLVRTFLRKGATGCGSCSALTTPKDLDEPDKLPVHPNQP
jgi:hypothetical protein